MPATRKTQSKRNTRTNTKSRGSSSLSRFGRLGSLLNNRIFVFAAVFIAVGAFVTYKYSMAATIPVGEVKGVGALLWSDEFNGTSLDLSKWQPNWHGGSDSAVTNPINTGEESCYDPKNVSVGNGTLKLKAEQRSFSGCNTREDGPARYVSGIVMSKKEDFKYGYYEARVFIPGDGKYGYNFPAFWTNGQHSRGWAQDGEIDIFEILGGGSRGELDWHYHYNIEPNNRSISTTDPVMSRHDGWHIFGLKREAGKQTFYYDGKEVGSNSSNLTSSPHYVIFNNGISSEHGGQKSVPATMEVDWFRYYALGDGSGDGGTSNTGGGSTTNTPPTVSLGSLQTAYTAPASVTLTATASDSDGIAKVEFYRGTVKIGEDTTSPYSVTSTFQEGAYTVTAKATDKKGLSATSNERTFRVTVPGTPEPEPDTPTESNGSPTVTFSNLSSSYTAPATVTVGVTAKDSDGIDRVSFYDQNDEWLGTDTSAPYAVTMRELSAGSYSVYVRATDNEGNTTTSPKQSFKVVRPSSDGGGDTSGGGSTTADKQAPSVPTNLSRSLNVEWMRYVLRLNWGASKDNVGVRDYQVTVTSPNGSKVYTTTDTTFGYTEMEANKQYTITVKARDAAGNVSGEARTSATAQCWWFYCSLK